MKELRTEVETRSTMAIVNVMNQDFIRFDSLMVQTSLDGKEQSSFLLQILNIFHILDPVSESLPDPIAKDTNKIKVTRKRIENTIIRMLREHFQNVVISSLPCLNQHNVESEILKQ